MVHYCADCDFAYDLDQPSSAGARIVDLAGEIALCLCGSDVECRKRPQPEVWSPLEYGCHVRDVLLVQRERVLAARRFSGAVCAQMGREERVEHDGYNAQNSVDVARQLGYAAALFSNVLARLVAGDWDRTVVYNYPEVQERTIRWVAIHTVHDVRHHLADIRRQLT